MNKQYREIDLHEALEAKIAGKEVEIFAHHSENWVKSYPAVLSLDHKHRILVEKYQPDNAETVMVRDSGDPWERDTEVFIGMERGFYVCVDKEHNRTPWTEVKPVEQPKPVAREWWMTIGRDGIPVYAKIQEGAIKVMEVLE